eukprot:s1_g2841.t1
MPTIFEISVTYHEEEAALSAARALVEGRLAACAHVEGPFTSIYWWDGKVQQEPEWRLIAKTSPSSKDATTAAIAKDHPYDLPGILTSSADVSDEFAAWVENETKP